MRHDDWTIIRGDYDRDYLREPYRPEPEPEPTYIIRGITAAEMDELALALYERALTMPEARKDIETLLRKCNKTETANEVRRMKG